MIDDSIEIPDDPETLERLGISIKGVILESTPAIIQFNLTQALLVSGIKKMKVVITTYENEQVLTRISSIPFYIRVEDECAREAEEYGSGCSLGSIYPYRLLDNSKSLTAINSSKGDIENYQQLFDEPDAEAEVEAYYKERSDEAGEDEETYSDKNWQRRVKYYGRI